MRPDEKHEPNVKFEQALDIRVMTIDGTRCGEGRLIEISDSEAQIELTGHAAELSEFFLMLTGFGNPVYRRCRRKWVHGAQIGVSFKRTDIGIKSSKELPQNAPVLPGRPVSAVTLAAVGKSLRRPGKSTRNSLSST
jgi:hypothetical protein